jgi:hypothetical protein
MSHQPLFTPIQAEHLRRFLAADRHLRLQSVKASRLKAENPVPALRNPF